MRKIIMFGSRAYFIVLGGLKILNNDFTDFTPIVFGLLAIVGIIVLVDVVRMLAVATTYLMAIRTHLTGDKFLKTVYGTFPKDLEEYIPGKVNSYQGSEEAKD